MGRDQPMPTPKNLSSLIPNTLQQIMANDVFSWRIEILELFSPFLSRPILVLNFTTYGLVLLGVVDEKLLLDIISSGHKVSTTQKNLV